jgi:hypothetical protein
MDYYVLIKNFGYKHSNIGGNFDMEKRHLWINGTWTKTDRYAHLKAPYTGEEIAEMMEEKFISFHWGME